MRLQTTIYDKELGKVRVQSNFETRFEEKINRLLSVYTIVTVVFLAKLFRLTTSRYTDVSDHKNNTHERNSRGKKPLASELWLYWNLLKQTVDSIRLKSATHERFSSGRSGGDHVFLIMFRCPVAFHSQFRCSQTDREVYKGQQRFHRK